MEELDRLVEAIHKSAKYRTVSEEVVRGLGARELAKGRSLREAIKATKSKLHQVGAAYLAGRLPYAQWLERLVQASQDGEPGRIREVCREAMAQHASTRERLPHLDSFFAQLLEPIAPVSSVLDVACGLNPLASPWMPLAPMAQYYGCEMYTDMVAFLNVAMPLLGVQTRIEACDATVSLPAIKTDVALVLKSLPCLEQLVPSCSTALLRQIRSDFVVVSYPVRSLGGRDRGMLRNYEQQLWALVEGEGWTVRRVLFESELVFVVNKSPRQ